MTAKHVPGKYQTWQQRNTTTDKFTIPPVSKCWKAWKRCGCGPRCTSAPPAKTGLHHLVYEVVDNSVDEALAGYCTEVNVTIHIDNSVTVVDNGRGIPVDMHEEEGVSAAQVVMTKLHAGGKFDSNSYKVSGGLHGVGVSCVNALSEALQLEIWRERTASYLGAGVRARRSQRRRWRRPARPATRPAPRSPSSRIRPSWTRPKFNFDTLAQRLRELAFLNKGLKITLTDEREEPAKQPKFHLQRRHRRIHQAPESRQERAARKADLLRRRARAAERRHAHHGSGAAVQRRLLAKRSSASPTTSTPWMAART